MVIIDVGGRLTLDVGDVLLRRQVAELLERGEKRVLIDLEGVTYIDSAGFGALHACRLSAEGTGASLKLLNVPRRVHRVLRLTELLETFEHFDDEAEAVRSWNR